MLVRPRSSRSLLLTAAAVVVGSLVVVPVAAAADGVPDASTATLVGELVQAWPEPGHAAAVGPDVAEAPLTWVETVDGRSVRVPTGDLDDVPQAVPGATVEVTLGRQ